MLVELYLVADTLTAEDLKKKIDSGDDFHLVNVLSEESFAAQHVPTSVNVPFSGDNFVDDFEEKVADDKSADVTVYCSSETCQASPNAAKKLEEAGYTNVSHFKGGLAGWEQAGFEFENGS